MKKYILTFAAMAMSVALMAVPAKRGFVERTLEDGTKVSLQLMGDEFAHWYESADGTIYRQNEDGTFAKAGVTRTAMAVKRKASPKYKTAQARRARMDFGKTPNPAPKGIVILVNFKDTKMKSNHTLATFQELCNSENCTVNEGYPSAAEYFKSQSGGLYHPVFDVFGPVTLCKNCSYYGSNDDSDQDEYATDAVIEACILAHQQYSNLNFAEYDSDNDGYVDFVYVIYAGKGEADGGAETTIWPHNWSIQELVTKYPDYSSYRKADTKMDGVYLDNYAMSSELSGNSLGGIGTLCHEFGHVMGLPDFYETNYGKNYTNAVTPNDWDIMDGGSYNGDGHCPPNYSPWEKFFFGWDTPTNLGNSGQKLELKANGTDGYQCYQINATGKQITSTTEGECYYIENRQQTGWDEGLPHHGLLIWKVNYNAEAWASNTPNGDDTKGSPLYTIVSASGTKIGTHINSAGDDYVYDGPKNPYPGSKNVTSKTIAGKPLLNIEETNGVITLTYIEEPTAPVDPFELTWMVGGVEYIKTTSTGKVELPEEDPEPCDQNSVFVGWCKDAQYESETKAPTFVLAGQKATKGDIYYAVFANVTDGAAEETHTYTFNSKSWGDDTNSWTSSADGNQLTTGQGVQVTSSKSGAGARSNEPFTKVTKVVMSYCTNAKNGAGSIEVTIGSTEIEKTITKEGGNQLRDVEFLFDRASGVVSFEVSCTTNSIYVNSISITAGEGVKYTNFTTKCETGSAVDQISAEQPVAVKVIRDGQVVIIRGEKTFSILGVQK